MIKGASYMGNLLFYTVITVTVLAEVKSQLETKRNLSVSKVSTEDITGSKWKDEIVDQGDHLGKVVDDSLVSSLDKFASKLKFETAAAKDMTKYKYFLQQMKHSNEYKLNHTQTLEKPDHDRNTENDLQETDARLSRGDYTRLFGSRLKKSSDEKPSSSVKYNRLNGANVNFLTRGIFPLQVAVVVSKPKGPNKNAVILVPLSVDMTVLDAFVAATQKYRNTTSSNVDEIPFNVVLDWDNKLKCYIVVKAVGIENKRKQAWFFTVRDLMFEIKYRNRCLPGDDVILRPLSSVQLTFSQTKRRFN